MFLGACRRRRRRGGLQLYQLRAAWGATGQLSGIWLGLWVSASGGAAQIASIFRSHFVIYFQVFLFIWSSEHRKPENRKTGKWVTGVLGGSRICPG